MDLDAMVLGELQNLRELLERIAESTADEPSGMYQVVSWDPAAPAGGAPAVAQATFRGRYKTVGVFNLSAAVITFALVPAGAASGVPHQVTLAARGFIVLPITGTDVSVWGAAAGDALIVATKNPQPLNAGTF